MKQKIEILETESVKIKEDFKKQGTGAGRLFILAVVLIVMLLFSYFCVIAYRPMYFSLAYVGRYISQNISEFFKWLVGSDLTTVVTFRVRRYLIVTLVGMALAAAGCMYKTIFRNTLAAPTTMGIQEGGVLGNMLFIFLFGGTSAAAGSSIAGSEIIQRISELGIIEYFGQKIFIFAGCFIGVGLVILIGTCAGKKTLSTAALVLVGTVVNGAIAGITGAIQYDLTMNAGDEDLLKLLLNMTMGTFEYSYAKSQLIVMSATLIPCMIVMLFFMNRMNIYSLGEEEARAMGMNVNAFKMFVIILGAFMTAITMIYVGHIAFIGFIVPQIAGKIVGTNFKKLYPASILLGGTVMLIVYDFATFTGLQDGISMITSFVGGFMLIFVLLKKRKKADGVIA